jgi:rfaE bifunctional protein nucleotidyltransferase chain/domain
LEKPQRLEEAFKNKNIHPDFLAEKIKQLKNQGLSIATINGSFDLLHAGHLYILFEAKKQADILLVALNSDQSIKRYKSSDRPIIDLSNRMLMLSAIEWVDYVTFFEEDDPRAILEKIAPDVHVNGAEYGQNCIEKATVEHLGGRLHLVDRVEGLSTSNIIKKIKTLCD